MGLLAWCRRWIEGEAREGAACEPGASLEDEIDAFNPFPEPVALEISDIFDLHMIAPRDVRRVVEEYLLEAKRAGFRSVRIIHGKGKGVQRETVRAILARTPFVEGWTDAPPLAGGWGATVAHLLPGQDNEPDNQPNNWPDN
jgi:hypothetical protein